MRIITLKDGRTGKTATIATSKTSIDKDILFTLPELPGSLITEEMTAQAISDAISQIPAPEPSGIDAAALVEMFATSPAKEKLLAGDSISIIETVDGVSVIKNITYAALTAELKEYFDTIYTGGGSGDGTVTGTSVAPEISGVMVANETQTITLEVTNYDPNSIYLFEVSGGSFSRVAGVIKWTLPVVVDSMSHKMTVTVTNPGKTPTSVFHPVNVFNINTTIDSLVLYEGATMSEFTKLTNISLSASKLLATVDTTLTISNNKISVPSTVSIGDKLLVDNAIYTVDGITLNPDGAANGSIVNAVSKATSDTTPEGMVIYDSQIDAAGYLAFDQSNGGGWRTNKAADLWIGFRFNIARVVNKYRIAGYNVAPSVAPKDWKFQASDDGITWTDLATVTGQTNWAASELREFTCVNSKAYFYYRVYITAGNGSADIGLASLELIEASPIVSATTPVLPQFITTAKHLSKVAISNTITQDSYETDFVGVSGLTVVYEQANVIRATATTTAIPTTLITVGDTIILENTTDGKRSIVVTSINYVSGVLDISSLGFTTPPVCGYRVDSTLEINIGGTTMTAENRTDTIIKVPSYYILGSANPNTTSNLPVLTGKVPELTYSTEYSTTFAIWKGFDNNLSTVACLWDNGTKWFKYDYVTPVSINKYYMEASTSVSGMSPTSNWNIMGSNDNVNWETLHTVTPADVTWDATVTRKYFTFDIDPAKTYRYYKVQVNDLGYRCFNNFGFITSQAADKLQIKSAYDDIITGNSARTISFKIKLNRIGDAVSKLSATLQKM